MFPSHTYSLVNIAPGRWEESSSMANRHHPPKNNEVGMTWSSHPSAFAPMTTLSTSTEKAQVVQYTKSGRKKWKKPKGKPKRPLSAYNLFFHSERERVHNDPNIVENAEEHGFGTLAKTIASIWRKMDETERKPYIEKAKEEREKYFVKLEEWKKEQKVKEETEKEELERRKEEQKLKFNLQHQEERLQYNFFFTDSQMAPTMRTMAIDKQYMGMKLREDTSSLHKEGSYYNNTPFLNNKVVSNKTNFLDSGAGNVPLLSSSRSMPFQPMSASSNRNVSVDMLLQQISAHTGEDEGSSSRCNKRQHGSTVVESSSGGKPDTCHSETFASLMKEEIGNLSDADDASNAPLSDAEEEDVCQGENGDKNVNENKVLPKMKRRLSSKTFNWD